MTPFKLDAGDRCVFAADAEVRIGCVFTDLPTQITVDATAPTTLADEFLLNGDGDLEIHRVYDLSGAKVKESIVAIAQHPTHSKAGDLLLLKNTELKTRLGALGIDPANVDLRVNRSMRQAIWGGVDDLALARKEVSLDKEDAKRIWDKVSEALPLFVLFRADRPSTDDDSEVQDPMKVAVRQALLEIGDQLEQIKDIVKRQTEDVAARSCPVRWCKSGSVRPAC